MKKIFCISSLRSVGCTFFDWSVHFLSGQSQFYHHLEHWVPLTNDPLTTVNAHLHKKNHPAGFVNSEKVLTQFLNSNDAGLYSAYPSTLVADIAAKAIGVSINECEISNHWAQVVNYTNTDYANVFNFCADNTIDFIYVDLDPNYPLYFLSARSFDRKMFSDNKPESQQENYNEIQQAFFRSSLKKWQDLNLTNIWDIRERMALDNRPFDLPKKPELDLSKQHLWLSSSDLWFRGLPTIKKILNYLNLELDQTRWDHWVNVYHKWQTFQLENLEFDIQFDHIIECIVNNWYYKLGELSLVQESIIQHALIYQHNLNLKTWQLEKFPLNTQDLHKLLESNIHPIETY